MVPVMAVQSPCHIGGRLGRCDEESVSADAPNADGNVGVHVVPVVAVPSPCHIGGRRGRCDEEPAPANVPGIYSVMAVTAWSRDRVLTAGAVSKNDHGKIPLASKGVSPAASMDVQRPKAKQVCFHADTDPIFNKHRSGKTSQFYQYWDEHFRNIGLSGAGLFES